jgi:hypothetical protein
VRATNVLALTYLPLAIFGVGIVHAEAREIFQEQLSVYIFMYVFSSPSFFVQIRFRHCRHFRHQVKYRITEAALIRFVDLISSPKRAIQSRFLNAFDLIDDAS